MIAPVLRRLLSFPLVRQPYRLVFQAAVECRSATEGDSMQVARLMEPLFPPAARHEALPAAERLLSETARCGGVYRIAERRGRIVAGCQLGPLMESAGFGGWWALGLWVHPYARGRGVGESLIQDSLSWAASQGHAELFCHIASNNRASLGLFRKLGFADASPELQSRVKERFGLAFGEENTIYVLRADVVKWIRDEKD